MTPRPTQRPTVPHDDAPAGTPTVPVPPPDPVAAYRAALDRAHDALCDAIRAQVAVRDGSNVYARLSLDVARRALRRLRDEAGRG